VTKLLVTGASGQLGDQAIEVLTQKTDKTDIVAIVRSDEQAAAFEGINRLLVSGSDMENRMSHHTIAVDQAK